MHGLLRVGVAVPWRRCGCHSGNATHGTRGRGLPCFRLALLPRPQRRWVLDTTREGMAVLWTGRAVRRRPVLKKGETLSVQAAVAAAATGRVLLCVGLAVPWTGCVCDGVQGQRRC